MERELVTERGWLSREQMREAIAVCQSLPGPLAIQVGIFICYLRAGARGAWAGGWAFILPNFLIVAAIGALYVHFGGLKPVTAIFYGVSPRHRTDPALLLSPGETGDGGSPSMGVGGRRQLSLRHRAVAGEVA
jgi:hypothetical protein